MNPNQIPDRYIDRVLNALRDAAPPTGMDRRILNILEAQSSEGVIPSGKKRSRAISAFGDAHAGKLFRWAPIACCAVLTIAFIFATRNHTARTATTSSPSTMTHTPASQPDTVRATRPASHAGSATNSDSHTTTPPHPPQPHRIEVAQSKDAQISHPAPPIPLTDQERILLRYARRGRTEDLAQISNDRKAAKEKQEMAEFQAFFTPPHIPIGESE